jgi:hypothetical protein
MLLRSPRCLCCSYVSSDGISVPAAALVTIAPSSDGIRTLVANRDGTSWWRGHDGGVAGALWCQEVDDRLTTEEASHAVGAELRAEAHLGEQCCSGGMP